MSEEKEAFLEFNQQPVAITLKFSDWGRICGALRGMSEMLDPALPMYFEILAVVEQITVQLAEETWNRAGPKEAANEDAN